MNYFKPHRSSVFRRSPHWRMRLASKVAQQKQFIVKSPIDGSELEESVTVYVDEPQIDTHLKASDFALDVQLRNGVQLQDCPAYFSPSTPEEYYQIVTNASGYYRNLVDEVKKKASDAAAKAAAKVSVDTAAKAAAASASV